MNLYWGALLVAIVTSMLAQALLKAGASASNFVAQLLEVRSIVGLVLYGAAALLYMVALRRIPVSVALPCTAISYVAAAIIGYYVFHEPIGLAQIGGIGLICAGVVLLAFG